jgi:general secretion pathway protein F
MPPATLSGTSFLFLAVKPGGGRTMGLRYANSRAALAELLRKERLLLLNAYPLPRWAGSQPADKPLSLSEQVVLNEQLAQLLARGVPLVEALEVAANTVAPRSRPRLLRLRELVATGSSFSDACRTTGGFDSVTIAVYRAAERTGDLASAANQIGQTARRTQAIAGRAVTLLIYPAIVVIVCLFVALLLLAVIVPMFGTQLLESGIDLPGYTRAMIATGVWIQNYWPWLLIAVFLIAVALFAARARFAAFIAAATRTLPLLRSVVLAQESARFFSTMAAMSRSGVPLADGLAVANPAISVPRLRTQMERLRTRLVEGGVLRQLIDEVDALPLATRRLLIAAERAGDLETAFASLANDMTDQVDRQSQRLLAVLQPALIFIMFIVIGALIASIMIPILTISGSVGG